MKFLLAVIFRQHSDFGHFQLFFRHNFRLKWKFWILIVSSERSSSELSEYTLLQTKKIFFVPMKINFQVKTISLVFFSKYFQSVGFLPFTHRSDGKAAFSSISHRTLQHHELSVVLFDDATGVKRSIIVQEQGGAAVTGVGGWGSHHWQMKKKCCCLMTTR